MSQGGQDEVKHLTALLTLMMAEDKKHKRKDKTKEARTALRTHEPICDKHTSQFSKDKKLELTLLHNEMAKQTDDPVLVQLDADYKGKLLYDIEDDLVDADLEKLQLDPEYKRTYQVLEITYDDKGGSPYFQVDCFEVRKEADGSWLPVPDHYNQVEDERTFKAGKLWNCMALSFKNPENTERESWVDEYIAAHEERGIVLPHIAAPGPAGAATPAARSAPKRRRCD